MCFSHAKGWLWVTGLSLMMESISLQLHMSDWQVPAKAYQEGFGAEQQVLHSPFPLHPLLDTWQSISWLPALSCWIQLPVAQMSSFASLRVRWVFVDVHKMSYLCFPLYGLSVVDYLLAKGLLFYEILMVRHLVSPIIMEWPSWEQPRSRSPSRPRRTLEGGPMHSNDTPQRSMKPLGARAVTTTELIWVLLIYSAYTTLLAWMTGSGRWPTHSSPTSIVSLVVHRSLVDASAMFVSTRP